MASAAARLALFYTLFLYSYLAKVFQHTCNNIAKELNNSHLYLKCHKNLLFLHPVLRLLPLVLVILLRVNWCLPRENGWVYRVRSMTSSQNEKNMTLPVTRTPISGYLKVSTISRLKLLRQIWKPKNNWAQLMLISLYLHSFLIFIISLLWQSWHAWQLMIETRMGRCLDKFLKGDRDYLHKTQNILGMISFLLKLFSVKIVCIRDWRRVGVIFHTFLASIHFRHLEKRIKGK